MSPRVVRKEETAASYQIPAFVRKVAVTPNFELEVRNEGEPVLGPQDEAADAMVALEARQKRDGFKQDTGNHGKFSSNNNTLCVVDGEGSPYVVPLYALDEGQYGRNGSKIRETLIQCGFQRGTLEIPHSVNSSEQQWVLDQLRERDPKLLAGRYQKKTGE